jgi:hypothetical protein
MGIEVSSAKAGDLVILCRADPTGQGQLQYFTGRVQRTTAKKLVLVNQWAEKPKNSNSDSYLLPVHIGFHEIMKLWCVGSYSGGKLTCAGPGQVPIEALVMHDLIVLVLQDGNENLWFTMGRTMYLRKKHVVTWPLWTVEKMAINKHKEYGSPKYFSYQVISQVYVVGSCRGREVAIASN